MTKKMISRGMVVAAAGAFLFLLAFPALAQEQRVHEEYQAQAMGQGTQLGQTFNVTLSIEEYSSPEERQVLIEAFEKAGSQGLYNALNTNAREGAHRDHRNARIRRHFRKEDPKSGWNRKDPRLTVTQNDQSKLTAAPTTAV